MTFKKNGKSMSHKMDKHIFSIDAIRKANIKMILKSKYGYDFDDNMLHLELTSEEIKNAWRKAYEKTFLD